LRKQNRVIGLLDLIAWIVLLCCTVAVIIFIAMLPGMIARSRSRPWAQAAAHQLPAGTTGDAANFTDRVKVAHVIRKVLLRQIAIMNYVWPF
jgi:uncharacterized protein involved in cysteine biosynthesis